MEVSLTEQNFAVGLTSLYNFCVFSLFSLCSSFWPQSPFFFGGLSSGYCNHLAWMFKGPYIDSWSAWALMYPTEACGQWVTGVEVWKLISSASVHSRLLMQDQVETIICETLKYYCRLASAPSLSHFPHSLSSSFWEYFHNANLISRSASGKIDLKQLFWYSFSLNSISNLYVVKY